MNSRTRITNGLRNHLRGLSYRRKDNVVTADDAQSYLSKYGIDKKKVRTRLSIVNSVLRTPQFESVGYRASERRAARNRQITEWMFNF